MEQNKDNNVFSYTYSAKEQDEIKRIRENYTPKTVEEDKMSYLRRLDASVIATAQIIALCLGVIGTLILGFGMSLCMTELRDVFSLSHNAALLLGIIVGVIGGILASLAYPVYNATVKHKREKLAPEIIRLTDELMK